MNKFSRQSRQSVFDGQGNFSLKSALTYMAIVHRFSAEDRRNQILDVATDLFARQGFQGTTTRAIAERAEVNEAIIFRHFPNKEVLYRAVLEKNARESGIAGTVREILDRDGDLRQSMVEIAATMLRKRIESPTFTRLFLYSALEGHELSNQFLRSYVSLAIANVGDFLRKSMERGLVRRGNAVLMARCFFGMMTHYILLHDLFGGDRAWAYDPEAIAADIVDVWIDGVLPQGSPQKKYSRKRRKGTRAGNPGTSVL
ncbi:MAG TPA: TetR/AcrR family transcriptional regulator [Candidatus Acidoferrales bacterium]|nr:TetR/AcrR family transcriptional regulator [Candidatus Acidoferrales bacterium]